MVVWGAPHLTERAGGLDFTVSPQSFRQTNPRQGEVLLRLISDAAGASLASAARPEDDVFAGCAVVTWVTSLCVWAVVCEAQSDRMAQWRQGWRLRVGRAGSNAVAVLSCSLAQWYSRADGQHVWGGSHVRGHGPGCTASILRDRARCRAGLRSGDALVDLYCGSGAVALGLARAACDAGIELASVTGADACAAVVRDGAANAARNGVARVRLLEADLDTPRGMATVQRAAPKPDVVVAGAPAAFLSGNRCMLRSAAILASPPVLPPARRLV